MPLDSTVPLIQKGIALPDIRCGPLSRVGQHVACMQIGDSLLPMRLGVKYSTVQSWAKRNRPAWVLTVRMTHEGHRVWRIA